MSVNEKTACERMTSIALFNGTSALAIFFSPMGKTDFLGQPVKACRGSLDFISPYKEGTRYASSIFAVKGSHLLQI